jgi:hypothetical protein
MARGAPTIHYRAYGRTACGRPDDRRDPEVSSWFAVNCRACLTAGFVEVVVGDWRIYAPEQNAERVLLVLEAVAALVKRGREPHTIRWILRSLLTQNLEARLPDDPALRGIPIRRFRARPGEGASAPPR